MKNKKLAKRAAAMKACILLHKAGEIDDNLVPVKRQVTENTNFLFKHWPEVDDKMTGTNKKKRIHPIHVSSKLTFSCYDFSWK